MNSPFFLSPTGAEPRQAKRESRVISRLPLFVLNWGGKTIFGNLYFPDSACGVIFCNNNTQATNSAFPDQWNFTCDMLLNHIRFVFFFFTTISKITKKIFVKTCWQLKPPTWTWKCNHSIMQMSYSVIVHVHCMCQTFISKTFANSLNMQR